MLAINEFSKEVFENAQEHGWWEEERRFGEIIALCHSELSEALEEDRQGNPTVYFSKDGKIETDLSKWSGEKLEGVATEMADCIIRILDWCGRNKIDIEKIIEMKHKYNKSRSYMHGGKKY